jgi:sarcosine oxidase subunit beta
MRRKELSADLRTSDIVVIGGGIMGASIAWHLARRGIGKVTLLERSTIASGASGKTGALLRQHYTNRPEATLAHLSLQVFRNWSEIVGGDCGFVESGLVFTIAKGPNQARNLASLEVNVAMQCEIGINTQIVTPSELLDLQPFLDISDLAAATLEPNSGYVNAVAATRSMALAAISAGVEIIENCEVLGIDVSGDHAVGVTTNTGSIATDTVICAAGPWSKTLTAPLGLDLPIAALRVQVAVLNRPLALERPHAAYIDTALGLFIRPWTEGQTMVGIGGGDQHDEVDPNNYEVRNSPGYGQLAITEIAKRMPLMAGASYSHGHAGLYDMTPDSHPIIGPAGPDGLYVAAGFSGAGFKKAPTVGQCVAEAIVYGTATTADLSPFSLNRFETDAWKQPWSETEYVLKSDFGHKF